MLLFSALAVLWEKLQNHPRRLSFLTDLFLLAQPLTTSCKSMYTWFLWTIVHIFLALHGRGIMNAFALSHLAQELFAIRLYFQTSGCYKPYSYCRSVTNSLKRHSTDTRGQIGMECILEVVQYSTSFPRFANQHPHLNNISHLHTAVILVLHRHHPIFILYSRNVNACH